MHCMQVDDDSSEANPQNDVHGNADQKHPRRWLSRWLHRREHGKQKSPAPPRPPSAKRTSKKDEHQGSKASDGKPAGW